MSNNNPNSWKKNNKSLLSKINNCNNGLVYFIKDTAFINISIITIIYIILSLIYLKNLETKCIFFIFGILIFCFEMINTIIENIVDRISLEKNELSKEIKDMSAGFIFIYTVSVYLTLFYLIYKKT